MAPFGSFAPLEEAATQEDVSPECGNPLPETDFRRQIEGELPFLQKIVRRWHRNRSDAEDLVQDTLLLALINAHLFQPGSNLRGWLFTIMRNQFFAGAARSQHSVSVLEEIAAAMMSGSVTSAPDARLVMRDTERALRRLPAPQKTAIRLIGIEAKSYSEAAHLMGTSIPGARCHLARARKRLRGAICDGDTAPVWTERRKAKDTSSKMAT